MITISRTAPADPAPAFPSEQAIQNKRESDPMFIVLLRFSDNKAQADRLMDDHKEWLQRGFDDDVFLLAGSIQPGLGGAVFAHNTSLEALLERVNTDPFVAEDVVKTEIIEVSPSRATDRLAFLGS